MNIYDIKQPEDIKECSIAQLQDLAQADTCLSDSKHCQNREDICPVISVWWS